MNLIMLGAPGAGKGTQAAILNQKLGIPTISTGNILRAAVKDGTPIGLKAKEYMDHGHLVPDEVIIGIINERLQAEDCKKGYILDGVPRTIAQAEALDKAGIVFDAVINLEISDEEILQRMSGRRVCEKCGASYHVVAIPPKVEGVCDVCGGALVQRADDAPKTVASRLEVYHRETEPLKEYYAQKGNLKEIFNQPTVEGTTQKILEALGQNA
ncbi:MAG: adenylate kinase [Clostridiales bacterium]|nr:adenylate kinase [bacterium 210917-SL.2.15]MCI5842745.1 adenylate kinase [Clostridiales bacterium]